MAGARMPHRSPRAARGRATIAFDATVENALSPHFSTAALRAAALLSLLLACAGCSVLKTNEEAQTVINQRVIGMPVGDFFDRYGRAKLREPQPDGSVEYSWISEITEKAPHAGWYGLDDRTCTMKIIAGKDGKITLANILQDTPGRTSTSRCLEMFKATT